MNPFSKRVNPRGNISILKKHLYSEPFIYTLDLSDIVLGQEITICSSRSDISAITNPSSYNTPRQESN